MPVTARAPAACPLDRTTTYRLHLLSKVTDRMTQAAFENEVGIPISEGRCLTAIGTFEPLSVNDLAQRANLNKGQASRSAQALVDQGLVLKQASDTDGRGVVLRLSDAGRPIWDRLMAVVHRRNAEITDCLSAAEARQLDQLLDRLIAHARGGR